MEQLNVSVEQSDLNKLDEVIEEDVTLQNRSHAIRTLIRREHGGRDGGD